LFDWLTRTEMGLSRTKDAWFGKVTRLFNIRTFRDDLWNELEELLILSDVGVDTSTKLIEAVKQRVKEDKILEPLQVRKALMGEMISLLRIASFTNHSGIGQESLRIILLVGVNGSGKTTSIAKLAYEAGSQGKRVILAAADTFRDAAIDQLKFWGKELGVDVIAHQSGADPGAVAFDAIQAANKRHAQVVLIDTAGRLQTKFNLMEELKKIKRVITKNQAAASLQVLLVMDATTGQNGLLQAKGFSQSIDITGIFLTKLDGTAKGGIVFAICDNLNIPIAYIGTGERLQDFAPFDAEVFVNAIFS
jgi:fused signal recognition particle receptor